MTVLNQSVLLQGINDDSATLIALSEKLFNSRVLPYYLHLLDRVQGAAHFEVSLETATPLLEQMRIALPGYLVPKLVREVAGMPRPKIEALCREFSYEPPTICTPQELREVHFR